MKTVPLGDVVDFYSGGTPSKSSPELWDGDVPWFSPKDMKQSRLTDSVDHISKTAFDKTSLRRLPAGTIAIVVRGMILAHTVPISILDVDAAINQDLKALIPKKPIHSGFLAAMLRAQHSSILSQVSTAAHGTKKLDSRVLEEIPIPDVPEHEQRRIAAILDAADTIRTKRRQVLAHLDSLGQSIFYQMFGDPDDATRVQPFGSVADLRGGRNLVADDASAKTPFRVLKISAVTTGEFRPTESKPLPADYEPPEAHLLQDGDLLMSRANTTEMVGAVAYVESAPPNLALPDKVWRFVWRAPCEPRFYHALLSTPALRRRISRLSSGTGGSMKNVSKARLESMPVPVVQVTAQREFVRRIDLVSRQRVKVRQVLAADDELFDSLQASAFAGRL